MEIEEHKKRMVDKQPVFLCLPWPFYRIGDRVCWSIFEQARRVMAKDKAQEADSLGFHCSLMRCP